MIANAITILRKGASVITPIIEKIWDLVNTNWELDNDNWES